jgi:hypothetical protein
MRFPRALDRGNLTEVLSAGSDLEHIGLTEALELCLLLRDKAPDRYGPAALRWHGRFCREVDSRVQCRCRRPHPQRENALCRKASRSSRQRRFQGRALAVAKLREAIRAVEQAREEAIAALGIEQWAKVFPHEDAGAGHLRLNLLKGGRLSKAMPNVTTITVATSVLQWLLDDAAWLGAVLADEAQDRPLDPHERAIWENSDEGRQAMALANQRIAEGLKPRAVHEAEWL